MIDQCCFSCDSVRPGRVQITSAETTCRSITIEWLSPLDENGVHYEVRIKVSYKEKSQTKTGTKTMLSAQTEWTLEYLPSGIPVKFSLTAINKQSLAGPTVYATIKTK